MSNPLFFTAAGFLCGIITYQLTVARELRAHIAELRERVAFWHERYATLQKALR